MYFDLNERSRAGNARGGAGGTVGGTGTTIGAPGAPGNAAAGVGGSTMSGVEQVAMYLFIVLGVLFAPIMNFVAKGTALPKEVVSLPIIIGALLVGFFIIPAIWEKVGAKQDAPLIVRLAVFFQNGVFWQALLGTIFAAAAGTTPTA